MFATKATAPAALSGLSAERWAKRCAYPLLAVFLVPLFIAVLIDRRAWPWDDAFYGTYSVSLFHQLLHSPLKWPLAMLRCFGDRAPGLAWFGQFFVPLGYVLPYVQSGLLCFTFLIQAASIFLLYKILSLSFGKTLPALVTCCIMASGSLLAGLTSMYLVEPLQALSTVWILGLAAYQERLSRLTLLLHTASAVAFGLLAKTSTPLFELPVVLYLIYAAVGKKPERNPGQKMWDNRRFLYATIIGTVLIVSSTVAWYVINYQATLAHVVDASSGAASFFYGRKASLSVKLIWWLEQFQRSFFWRPLLLFILLMVPRALFARWKQRLGLTTPDVLALLSILSISIILVSFSLNINEDTRYLFGLLPYVAFVVCWVAVNTRFHRLLFVLEALAVVQLALVSLQMFGAVPQRAGFSNYLQPLERNDLALRDSIFCAAKTLDSSLERPTFTGEGVPDFNANGLAFYNTIEGGQGTVYVGLGWVHSDSGLESARIKGANSKYYVYRKYPAIGDSDPPNQVAKSLFARIANDLQFSYRPDKSNDRVLVFENIPGGSRYTGEVDQSSIGYQGVDPSGKLPYGLLEFPKKGFVLQGRDVLLVTGWAVAPSGMGPIQVFMDGQHAADAARNSRPDVAKAYPKGESTGFTANVNVSSLADGLHEASVVVYGRDGSSRRIAIMPVSTSLDFPGTNPQQRLPFGLLEYPRAGILVSGKILPVIGWTVVPSGFGSIEIWMDGRHITNAAPQSRPDVKKAYPSFASSSGFKADLDVSSVTPGSHRVTIISRSADGLSRVMARVSIFRQ